MKNVQVNSDGLQFDNANGTHTNVNTSATADTYINLPSSSGTLALTSDVPSSTYTVADAGLWTSYTQRVSTTTLTDVTDVNFDIVSGSKYVLRMNFYAQTAHPTTYNHKFRFANYGAASVQIGRLTVQNQGGGSAIDTPTFNYTGGCNSFFAVDGQEFNFAQTLNTFWNLEVYFTASSTATLTLQFAQAASNGNESQIDTVGWTLIKVG